MDFDPIKENLTIHIGATFEPSPWVWSTGTTEATATPVDLTGCSALMHVREKLDAIAILETFSTDNGRIVLGGMAGTIAPKMVDEDTAVVTWKSGVYDLKITFPDGDSVFFAEGNISAKKKVTRSA